MYKDKNNYTNMSTVYFTNLRTTSANNLQKKMLRLIKAAGLETIDFSHKFTAIKLHFGERWTNVTNWSWFSNAVLG